MEDFRKKLEEGYKEYVASRIGIDRGSPRFRHQTIMYLNEACKAAQTIVGDYDLGIELARDGLFLGYIFRLHGFPTKAVKLGRKGFGATWQPIDDIAEEDIQNKRVILFDNDVLTGRTLNRAVEELGKFSPTYTDLLLMHEKTPVTIRYYRKLAKKCLVEPIELAVQNSYSITPLEVRETTEGVEIDYQREEEGDHRTMRLTNDNLLGISVRDNISPEIRKVMTLQKDFKDADEEYVAKLEKILIDT